MKRSETYENEQAELKDRITELQDFISNEQESAVNTDRFIRLVKKYTDVQELNAEIIREFVEKIYIYKAERIGGKKVQKIKNRMELYRRFHTVSKGKTGAATPT